MVTISGKGSSTKDTKDHEGRPEDGTVHGNPTHLWCDHHLDGALLRFDRRTVTNVLLRNEATATYLDQVREAIDSVLWLNDGFLVMNQATSKKTSTVLRMRPANVRPHSRSARTIAITPARRPATPNPSQTRKPHSNHWKWGADTPATRPQANPKKGADSAIALHTGAARFRERCCSCSA